MAYFPFMIQLEDKTCLLIGGGNVAARKAEMMLEFGAQVHLVAKQVCDKIWKIKIRTSRLRSEAISRKTSKERILSLWRQMTAN